MKPGRTGLARLWDASLNSLRGLHSCWANEAAFRQEIALLAVLVPLSFLVARSVEQWLLLTAPLLLLLIVELLNSAIEATVDRIGPERNELSGRAKDLGSAAVLLCQVLIGLTWASLAWRNFFT